MCAISTIERITTPRLRLRPLALSDARPMVALLDDAEIARRMVRIPHPYTAADAETFLGTIIPGADGWILGIEDHDRALIGVIGLERQGGRCRELGYWLGRPFWGRGYATEAASALLQWARDAQGVRAAMAGHFVDNPASGRVLEKAGFLYTGETVEHDSLGRGERVKSRRMAWLA